MSESEQNPSAAGILSAQWAAPTQPRLPAGLNFPQGEEETSPILFVPDDLPDGPIPLVLMLHGASGKPRQTLSILRGEAQRRKFLVLIPKSRNQTWDALRGQWGPDVEAIDELLRYTF